MTEQPHIRIFDTTMRDGEQSPGASMTLREKLDLAELLSDMKVDVIEAGFPAASMGDFDCVCQIAEQTQSDTFVCGLARSTEGDIARCAEAVRGAANPRIHTFIATSPLHMEHKLKMGENAVLEAIGRSVTQARNAVGDVEWSAEDATRSDFDFLCLGDLTWNVEHDLVCPENRIGEVDLYMVTHHGLSNSNNPVLVHAVKPTVAVACNGPHKGAHPEVINTLRSSDPLEAIYQLHLNLDATIAQNTDKKFIANLMDPCNARYIVTRVHKSSEHYSLQIENSSSSRRFESK